MELVEIYSGESMKMQMIVNLLQENGIPAFLKNEFMGNIAPFYITPGGTGATSVEVPDNFAEEAKQIIDNFFNSADTE